MALEWTLIHQTSVAIPMTVADGVGIEKGALLVLSDPMTAATATAAANLIIAGVAAEEKIASDGRTKISVYRRGVFKCTAGGAITVGDPLETSAGAVNEVIKSTPAASGSQNVIGVALETASDADTLLVELNPYRVDDPA